MSRDAIEADTPWWLESGSETCQFCLRTFHYEAGYHCIHCDQPICPICVIELEETRDTICPACRDEGVS